MLLLFNWLAFQKVTTFTCSFGATDVNVSVFNMSFSGADVGGPDLVRAAEGADGQDQSVHSGFLVIFFSCHSSLDFFSLINAPRVYHQAAELKLQQM